MRPFTKDLYMQQYEKFIIEIKSEYLTLSPSEWKQLDKTYTLYSETCYDKFKPEMTEKEEYQVIQWSLQYHYYKLCATGNNLARQFENWILEAENKILQL